MSWDIDCIKWLNSLKTFTLPPKPKYIPPPKHIQREKGILTINMAEHHTWGDNIYWLDWKKRKIVGWMPIKPHVGDKIRCELQSHRIAEFEVIHEEYIDKPHDMFIITVKDLDYVK